MPFDPTTLLGGYTEAELAAAFALVVPKPNWKMPVAAIIPTPVEADAAKIAFAVEFYTGGKAIFTELAFGQTMVTAPGYYTSVGA